MVDKLSSDESLEFDFYAEDEEEEPFDQFADEMEFYSQRGPIRDDDDMATTDSGYNSPRFVVDERDNNQPRKSTVVVNCNRFDMKLTRLKDLRLLEQKVRRYFGQEAIAWHLLDFISPKAGSDHRLPRSQGMFQVANDRVHVHSVYDRAGTGGQQIGVSEMFVNIANSLLDTHNQLIDLEDFAEQQRRITNPPPFITGWLELYDVFINEYLRDISHLKNTCTHPLVALSKSAFLREQVSLLHSIIHPIKAAFMWKFEETDLSWSLLLTAIADCSHLTGAQTSVALDLQKTFYSILLSTMDHLYSHGQLPSSNKDHFVIQGDKSRSDVFHARKISRGSVLWNKNLVDTLIRGITLRQRLPDYFMSPTCFSDAFNGLLAENWTERLIPLTEMRWAFQESCARLTNELSEEMFRRVVDAGIHHLWRDMKSIALGVTASLFVSSVFNLENMQHSESDAFRNAIRVGGVSSVARWGRSSVPGFTGVLNCEVTGVLSHLVNKSLLSAINQGLDSWMKLYRMHFLLVAILGTKDCLERSKVKRQFQFLVTKLFSVVETIRDHFYRMFSDVFDSASELMKQANSFYELEKILQGAENGILTLVNNSTDPTARELWAAVDRFSVLVDDIRLRSLSMAVSRESIDEWRRSFLFSCETLSSLGRTATADNVFFSLCSKIQYR